MNFKEYFKIYNAQEKINKLAQKYKNRKIIIYGAGQFAEVLFNEYDLSKLNIVAVCDKKFEKEEYRNFYGLNCISPNELVDFNFDLILISNFDYKKFANIIDDILYGTKKAAIEIRPVIKLDFNDLFANTRRQK